MAINPPRMSRPLWKFGRRQVEPHDVADLLDEERITRGFPALLTVRLEPERPPDPSTSRRGLANVLFVTDNLGVRETATDGVSGGRVTMSGSPHSSVVGPIGPGSPPRAFPTPGDPTVAQQVVDLTRVVSDASRAVPGRAVTVEVIPGVLPGVPSISQLLQSALEAGKALDPTQPVEPGAVGGELVSTELPVVDETFSNLQITPPGGLPTTLNGTVEVTPTGDLKQTLLAAVDGVVSTVSDILEISVGYSVVDADGKPLRFGHDFTVLNAVENQLGASVLIRPSFVDDTLLLPADEFQIVVHVVVRVRLPALAGGAHVEAEKTVRIPVVLPAVRVPAVLLLAANRDFGLDDERVVVILRQQSPHRVVSDLVQGLNDVMDVLGGLRALIPFVPIVRGLTVLAQVLATTPLIYTAFGDVPNLESYGEPHEAMLLFGVERTKVTFFDDTDYDKDWTLDVVVPATNVGALSVPLGIVFHSSLYDFWKTSHGRKSPESLKWIGPTIDVNKLKLM